jgi:hypothetical protein
MLFSLNGKHYSCSKNSVDSLAVRSEIIKIKITQIAKDACRAIYGNRQRGGRREKKPERDAS